MSNKIRDIKFFTQDAETLAKALLGKVLCHRTFDKNNEPFIIRGRIMETEAYRACDAATDANRTKTKNSQYLSGGHLYFHKGRERIDIVANQENIPESVLIRAIDSYGSHPSYVVWAMDFTSKDDGKDLLEKDDGTDCIWLEDDGCEIELNEPAKRVEIEDEAKLNFSIKALSFN